MQIGIGGNAATLKAIVDEAVAVEEGDLTNRSGQLYRSALAIENSAACCGHACRWLRLHRQVRRLGGRLGDGRRRRDVLEAITWV
jgi:hypothetical protein